MTQIFQKLNEKKKNPELNTRSNNSKNSEEKKQNKSLFFKDLLRSKTVKKNKCNRELALNLKMEEINKKSIQNIKEININNNITIINNNINKNEKNCNNNLENYNEKNINNKKLKRNKTESKKSKKSNLSYFSNFIKNKFFCCL